MTSGIGNLFGSVDSNKLESNINKLFATSTGPIKVSPKKRTITKASDELTEKKESEEEKKQQDSQEENVSEEKPESDDKQDTEETQVEKTIPKRKKRKVQDENEDLENKYFTKLLNEDSDKKEKETVTEKEKESEKESEKADTTNDKEKVGSSAKKVDLKEDELEKAERTIFIGNLPNSVITSKDIYKEFKKLFMRNPNPEDKQDNKKKNAKEEEKEKENPFAIESIRFRSISFDEALPRKVAFVQQKFHKLRDSVNAYIVYKRRKAVKQIAKHLNGMEFHDRHLRVDSVAHPSVHENKRSIFVGNLDFEEDEENLWKHFLSCGDIEYVRIVRDSKTNLGKGFAYVQFKDLQSVNKALLLADKVMIKKDGKKGRKLRVTRCKNMHKNSHDSNSVTRKFEKNLTDNQRTKVGRVKKILGKADKATLGSQITIEGLRSTKGNSSASHLKQKKQRSKTGRVTKRSMAFKKRQANESK
ncbi:hypothetical protein TBLA_0A04750 [Henningerozyma blattae CBS 6284]|uniref:Nucleolar protein 12 n=1 Tax=Henningerozyma blattae (strain ATCC 34711 / CBS 6284 / DSM 70876 / NBRC 10599 / NRRL Y-10934 / UCD 77-7) TaxID=1071380 RepID=I2GVW6_HENB6|nr:hypothetical protein TBLA_0A04750 [Tetrapisispora blattae CBS 6284]CCH58268.1 hypothetical protein TBLA_0A04750 [Tetrapisispora blattae CBS 6284]